MEGVRNCFYTMFPKEFLNVVRSKSASALTENTATRKGRSLTFPEINKYCHPSFLWKMIINSMCLLYSCVQHGWHSKSSRQRLAPRATMDSDCTLFYIPVKQPCRQCALCSGSPPALRRCRSHTTGCCQGRNRNSLQQSCQAGTRNFSTAKTSVSGRWGKEGVKHSQGPVGSSARLCSHNAPVKCSFQGLPGVRVVWVQVN